MITSDGYIKEKGDFYGLIVEADRRNQFEEFRKDGESTISEKPPHIYKNLEINFSHRGIEFLESSKFKLKNLRIRNSNYGIYFKGKELIIENSDVSLCDTGIYLLKGNGYIKETRVASSEVDVVYRGTSEIDICRSYIVNNKIGIYVDENSKPDLRNGYSYICHNLHYNLYNNTRFDLEAYMNWWGTLNKDSISLLIYDFFDDTSKGIVNFEPIWIPNIKVSSGIQVEQIEKEKTVDLVKINNVAFRYIEIELTLSKNQKSLWIFTMFPEKR
ncbi:MAG: NosD domain-containing protein [Candidatus Hydrothermales bacterium]